MKILTLIPISQLPNSPSQKNQRWLIFFDVIFAYQSNLIKNFFLLEYSCFTVLYSFWAYSRVYSVILTQVHMCFVVRSRLVISNSDTHGLQPTRLLCPWSGLPCPPSGGLPDQRDWIQVSCIVGGFFTIWVTREARIYIHSLFLRFSSPSGH